VQQKNKAACIKKIDENFAEMERIVLPRRYLEGLAR